jgi:hypothetical protein
MNIRGYVMGYVGNEEFRPISPANVYVRLVIQGLAFDINNIGHLKKIKNSLPQIFVDLNSKTKPTGIRGKLGRIKKGLQKAFPFVAVNENGEFNFENLPEGDWDYQIWAIIGKNIDDAHQGKSRVIRRNEKNVNVEVAVIDPTVQPISGSTGTVHSKKEYRLLWE